MEQKKTTPLVSVIIPAYNAERFLEETVRSVMNQTVQDWELLILDDCATDGTYALAERLAAEDDRITLLKNEQNMGVARTRNRGFDLCRGKYVALLDSDDVWHPEKLERQLARMEETAADFSYTSYAIVDIEGKKTKADFLVPGEVTYSDQLTRNAIGCSTVMLKKELLDKYRFATDFYHEDYVLWVQLLRDGCRAAGCTEVLVDWRYVENSRSFNKMKAARNRWRIYRDYLKLPLHERIRFFAVYAVTSVIKYK